MIDARTAAAAIEAAVEWTMKQIQSRDEAPRSWDAGFPSIKASALLCLLPTFDPDRWLAIRDERIQLGARLDEAEIWLDNIALLVNPSWKLNGQKIVSPNSKRR